MKTLILSLSLLLTTFIANADVLTLMNGQAFQGEVRKIKNCEIVFVASGDKYYIPADSIFSIQFEDVNNKVYQDYLALANDPQACLKGTTDAQQFHGKAGAHVLLGFLFGPFAMIGAALASPNPYNGRMTPFASQNKDLFNDPVYLKCYKKKAKGRNVGYATLGWGIWIMIVIAIS